MRASDTRRWSAALVLLCIATLWLEFRHIDRTMPYPRHVDEVFISGPARRTIVTGTLHPHTFNYPSLPKYLAAAGMAAGFVRAAGNREIQLIQRLGEVGYPYYQTPLAMKTARQLFAALAVLAVAATGITAWLALGQPAAIFLAPFILVTSPLFFFHSWTYLNVDIVGACFAMLALASCLAGTRRAAPMSWFVIAAACAGLAAGSKYTLGIVLLPVLVAIALQFRGTRRAAAWAVAIGAAAAAFLLAVPYSLIDIPGFLNGLASEAFHYASGHRGFQDDPGWPQVRFYLRHFASDFGVPAVALAAVGLAVFARRDWRRALIVLAFPFALLWLLASQRVHFPRNVLALHPLLAIFAAMGILALHGWLSALAARRGWTAPGRERTISLLIAVVLILLTVRVSNLRSHMRDRIDSRRVVLAWIEERIPKDWTIVVPRELAFNLRTLEATGRAVMAIDLQGATDPSSLKALLRDVPPTAVILSPRWGADRRWPGQERAPALNELTSGWRVLERFGTNDVLVNYSYSTPWGDPAFAVALLNR